MTLCAAVNLNGRGICLVADSVVTTAEPPRRILVGADGELIREELDVAGRTSKDEAYQPLSHDGGVDYFSEIACKLTHLGPDLFVAFSGEEVFCRLLAEALAQNEGYVRLDKVEAHVRRALSRVSDRFKAPAALSAEALLCGKTRARALAIFRIEVRCEHATNHVLVIPQPPNLIALIGSGAAEFSGSHLSPSPFYRDKPIPQAVCLFASELSLIMRRKLRGLARGVGGTYFGAAVDLENSRSYYMPSVVEAMVDSSGRLKYLTKTIFEDGLFYVHDYLGPITVVCPVLTIQERVVLNHVQQALPRLQREEFAGFNAMNVIIRNEKDQEGMSATTLFAPGGCGDRVRWGKSMAGEVRFIVEFDERRGLAVPLPIGWPRLKT